MSTARRPRIQALAVATMANLTAAVFLLIGESELANGQMDMQILLTEEGAEMDDATYDALRDTVLLNFEDCAPILKALAHQAEKAAAERTTLAEAPYAVVPALPEGVPVSRRLEQDNTFASLLDKLNAPGTKGVRS